MIDVDLEKPIKKYIEALDVNYESLKRGNTNDSVMMAETEHRWFTNKNTSSQAEQALPEGTPRAYLTAVHVQRHMELLQSDQEIEAEELRVLMGHIAQDRDNLQAMMMEERDKMVQQINPQSLGQVGGIGGSVTPSAAVSQPALQQGAGGQSV